MRALILAGAFAAASAVAFAAEPAAPPKSVCINANFAYNARSLNQHDVFIQKAVGKTRPAARLRTSCINLEPATAIAVHSPFSCIGLGDQVAASTIDGRREQCIVTRVLPYAPEEGDKKN